MSRIRRHLAIAAILAFGVVACGDDIQVTDPDPDPPPALSVSLTPENIDLDVGDIVNLSVGITGGAADAQATITCESSDTGVVSTSVSGSTCVVEAVGAGSATVTATVEKGDQEASAAASVTVQEDPQAATVASVSGDQQLLGFNDESQALVVRVDDQFGIPFAGAEVAFSGDGVAHTLSSTSVTTNSSGEASITVTSGQEEGDIAVTASVDGVGVVTFTLEVEDDTPDPEAHNIVAVSGEGQTVTLGEESTPLVIRVDDQFGNPFPGAQVEFSGSGVDHTLSATSETTDGDGRASITVTAGQEEGTIQVSASVEGAGTLTFNVEVEDDTPDPEAASLDRFSGNNQVLDLGQESNGLVVQVRDQFGDPFPGAQVTYSGSGVDHTLSSSSATTGTNGRTSVTVTAGQDEGGITVDAEVAGVGTVTFTLQVEEGEEDPEATALVRVSGDGQTLDHGEASEPLVVRVDNQFGDPLPGVTVGFSGDGVAHTLSDDSQTTGTDGQASITVTAGQANGTITVTASVDGVAEDVIFILTVEEAAAPVADEIIRVSGHDQTLDFDEQSEPLLVRVQDQAGANFEGAEVTFVGAGAGHTLSSPTATTNVDGEASITVTSQQEGGTITVTASVDGVAEDVIFTLNVEEAAAPVADTLISVSGDGQTLDFDEQSEPLVVRVDDQFGNPLPGVTVGFSGDGVAHTLSDDSQTTGTDGQASITVTAGAVDGAITVTASVDGVVEDVIFTLNVEEAAAPTSYSTDFSGYTVGDFPNDWTDRGLGAAATSITVESEAGGNVLRIDLPAQDPTIHRGISWDHPGNQADVRVEATVVPGSGFVPVYITARGTSDDTYYRLQIRDNDRLELVKVVNGTPEVPIGGDGSTAVEAFTYGADATVMLEFEVEGNQLRGRAWTGSAPSGWMVEITDTDITSAGWTGLGRLHEGVVDILDFTVTPLN